MSGRPVRHYVGYRHPDSMIVLLQQIDSVDSHARWKGRCDCGTFLEITSSNVKTQRTCGCTKPNHKNYIRVNPFSVLYKANILREHDNTHGPPLTLTEYESMAQDDCYLCGKPPSSTHKDTPGVLFQGIDRRLNWRSYQADNCEPCCGPCNSMKSNRTLEEHKENIRRSYHHLFG
jgi:hypothetical protein